MKKLLILLAFSTQLSLIAQGKFQPGKIITTEGDTIPGFIDTKPASKLFKLCIFKTDKNADSTKYASFHIKGFELASGRTFVSAINPTDGEPVFMEFICDGRLRLLALNDDFFIQESQNNAIYALRYSRKDLYVDNGYSRRMKVVENKEYVDVLKALMKDNESLHAQIEKTTRPERVTLSRIVNAYNSKIEMETQTVKTAQAVQIDELTFLRKGKMNLYADPNDATRFYIQKQGGLLSEISYSSHNDLNYNGISIHSHANTTEHHIDTLMKYMDDAKLLYPTIVLIKKPGIKNLEKLVDEYNNYTDDETYIRKHTIKRLPLNIDIIPGMYFPDSKNTNYKFGALMNIGFIKSNKNLFLKTGVFSYISITESLIQYYNDAYIVPYSDPVRAYKMPLQLEFRLNGKYVEPLLAVGYNIYLLDNTTRDSYFFPTVSPGVNFNFSQRLAFHVNLDWEYRKKSTTELFPGYFDSFYVFTGLKIKL